MQGEHIRSDGNETACDMTDRKEASTLSDAEIRSGLIDMMPKVGEPEAEWSMIRTSLGRAIIAALESRLAVGQPVAPVHWAVMGPIGHAAAAVYNTLDHAQDALARWTRSGVPNLELVPLYAHPAPAVGQPVASVRDVLAERRRQIEVEGWTPEHDAEHPVGDLERAAATYALYTYGVPGSAKVDGLDAPCLWPWDWKWLKPKDRRSDLVRAAALLLAAIDKGDREYALRDAAQSPNAAAQEAPNTVGLSNNPPPVAAAPDRPQEPQGDATLLVTLQSMLATMGQAEARGDFRSSSPNMQDNWDSVQREAVAAITGLEAAPAPTEQKSPDRLAQECRDLAREACGNTRPHILTERYALRDRLLSAIDRLAALPQECTTVLMELLAAQENYARAHMAEENAINNYSGDQSRYSRDTIDALTRVSKAEAAARALCDRLEKT